MSIQCVTIRLKRLSLIYLVCFLLSACSASRAGESGTEIFAEALDSESLPALSAVGLAADERLRVVASTNIVADVVAQVGADRIELFRLMPIGVDPHSFEPTPQDLIALNEAHAIFINGLNLEEPLAPILETLDGNGALVSVNAGVETIEMGAVKMTDEADVKGEEGHAHHQGGPDPHTWFSIRAVKQWVENVEQVLTQLDPAGADVYSANAANYLAQLDALAAELDSLVAELPLEKRKLVTDHGSLGYLAAEYDFEPIGTVLSSFSTLASPAARELAQLQDQIRDEGIEAIFVGNSVNSALAEQLAADMGLDIATLYTDSFSEADGPAANYLDFMRYNISTIVDALK